MHQQATSNVNAALTNDLIAMRANAVETKKLERHLRQQASIESARKKKNEQLQKQRRRICGTTETSTAAATSKVLESYNKPAKHIEHCSVADGVYVPFWERDQHAIRERETRIKPLDHPDAAERVAKAKAIVGERNKTKILIQIAIHAEIVA